MMIKSLLNRRKRLSDSARASVMEYLAFRIKHGVPLMRALKNYVDGRTGSEAAVIQRVINRVAANEDINDVMLDCGLIDQAGYTILTSGIPLSKGIPVLVNMSSNRSAFNLIFASIITNPLLILLSIGAGLVYGNEILVRVFTESNTIAAQAGRSDIATIPLYVEYPWLLLEQAAGLIGVMVAAWAASGRIYATFTHLTYRIMPWRHYEDWLAALSIYIALQRSGQSSVSAMRILSEKAISPLIRQAMAAATTNKGVRMTEGLLSVPHAIPKDLRGFFHDAEQTGETIHYLSQATEYCKSRIDTYQRRMRTSGSLAAYLLTFLMVGIVVISITAGVMKSSLLPMI